MLTFLITGFVLGITSSLHCMGMCGPIAMALPLNRRSTGSILFGAFQYNFGRVVTYSILGVIVGSVGLTIHTFGFLQWTSIIAGALLIVFAWRKFFSRISFLHAPTLFFNTGLNSLLGKVIRSKNPAKLFLLGGLNGLLPCGMVYIALLNAILAGNPYGSALAMVAFGLGTLPAMIFVSVAFSKITNEKRKSYQKVLPYLLTVVGLLIILRGMNLDIPYLSPKISVTTSQEEDQQEKTEVEMSCCHKNQECK